MRFYTFFLPLSCGFSRAFLKLGPYRRVEVEVRMGSVCSRLRSVPSDRNHREECCDSHRDPRKAPLPPAVAERPSEVLSSTEIEQRHARLDKQDSPAPNIVRRHPKSEPRIVTRYEAERSAFPLGVVHARSLDLDGG